MTVELFKNGDTMAIRSSEPDEETFLCAMSVALSDLIDRKVFDQDWEFQLGYWLPQIVDICCKYRGYKSEVLEERVLLAGQISVNEKDLCIRADTRGRGHCFTPPDSTLPLSPEPSRSDV